MIQLTDKEKELFDFINEIEIWEIVDDPLRYYKHIILVIECRQGAIEIRKDNFFVTTFSNGCLTESIHFHKPLLDFINAVQKRNL